MKRILTLLTIATFASCSIFAQDDMYFTPKSKAVKEKERAEAKAAEEKRQAEEEARVLQIKKEWLRKNRQHLSETEDGKIVYHAGRDISDDEYNRRGKFSSSYAIVSDSVGSDIIDFTPGDGQYPDSIIASIDTLSGTIAKKSTDRYDDDDDYYYSRRMNRFDDFYGSRRMWLLYNDPWYSHWAYDPFFWNDPWYWNRSWVYDPWYWNDPWYYGGYYGYYSRYYYGGYYGWTTYHPYHHRRYYYTPVALTGSGGTHHSIRGSHGRQASRQGYRSVSSDIKTRDRQYGSSSRNGDFTGYRGNRPSSNSSSARSISSYSNNSSSRSSSSPSRSYSNSSSSSSSSSSRSSSSGGSFGGSRGGGGGGVGHGGRR